VLFFSMFFIFKCSCSVRKSRIRTAENAVSGECDHLIVCLPYLFHFCLFFQRVILGAKHNVRRRRKTAQRNHAKRTKRLPLPQKWTRFFCKKIQHSFKVCPEWKDWLDSRKGKTLRDHLASVREYHLFICVFNLHFYIGDIFYYILIYILIFILFI
jgi:hypothetical protein